MGRYDEIIYILNEKNLLSRFSKLSDQEVNAEIEENPDMPDDYIEFLKCVGYGDIGDDNYMIYSGLVTPEDIFDEITSKTLKNILLFGDDFNGYCAGFLTTDNWRLVEVGNCCNVLDLEGTFESFIKGKINTWIKWVISLNN